MVLNLGCGPGPERSRPSPALVVEDLHSAWLAGDIGRVHEHVAYPFRAAEALGALWTEGSAADRARLVELLQKMLTETMDTHWNKHVAGRRLIITERYERPDIAWVHVRAPKPDHAPPGGEEPVDFEWQYRLHNFDGVWKITQREWMLAGYITSSTDRYFPQLIGHLAKTYGRRPTLAEVNANIPSYKGRIRKKVFRIPELP